MPLELEFAKYLSPESRDTQVVAVDELYFRVAIQTAMAKRGIKQNKLAQLAGCSAKSVSRILNDMAHFPEYETLGSIANVLGLNVEQLVRSVIIGKVKREELKTKSPHKQESDESEQASPEAELNLTRASGAVEEESHPNISYTDNTYNT